MECLCNGYIDALSIAPCVHAIKIHLVGSIPTVAAVRTRSHGHLQVAAPASGSSSSATASEGDVAAAGAGAGPEVVGEDVARYAAHVTELLGIAVGAVYGLLQEAEGGSEFVRLSGVRGNSGRSDATVRGCLDVMAVCVRCHDRLLRALRGGQGQGHGQGSLGEIAGIEHASTGSLVGAVVLGYYEGALAQAMSEVAGGAGAGAGGGSSVSLSAVASAFSVLPLCRALTDELYSLLTADNVAQLQRCIRLYCSLQQHASTSAGTIQDLNYDLILKSSLRCLELELAAERCAAATAAPPICFAFDACMSMPMLDTWLDACLQLYCHCLIAIASRVQECAAERAPAVVGEYDPGRLRVHPQGDGDGWAGQPVVFVRPVPFRCILRPGKQLQCQLQFQLQQF